MAVTTTLVSSGANRLRYKMINTAAETGTVTCSGAASPDIQTDSANGGTLHKISLTKANGYGKIAAGALTQAQARSLFLSDDPTNVVGTGVPKALATYNARTAITAALDANVDGPGNPTIEIIFSAAGTGYLDVWVPGVQGI